MMDQEYRAPILKGRSEMIYEGNSIALLPIGSMVKTGCQVYEMLKAEGERVLFVSLGICKASG